MVDQKKETRCTVCNAVQPEPLDAIEKRNRLIVMLQEKISLLETEVECYHQELTRLQDCLNKLRNKYFLTYEAKDAKMHPPEDFERDPH